MAKQRDMSKYSATLLFLKETLRNFSTIGAVIPTSAYTARKMAQLVSNSSQGYVVELGAGTGVITAALLKHLTDPKRLIVIEKSLEMANYLQKRFPEVHVIHGDALHLQALLSDYGDQISTIISALPFTLMSKSLVEQIGQQIENVLTKDGRLIQITYKRKQDPKFPAPLKLQYSKYVWFNVPPARIAVFQHDPKLYSINEKLTSTSNKRH